MESMLISGLIVLLLAIILIVLSSKKTIVLKSDAIDLAKVMPIQCIEDNLIVNGNGDITAGFKIFFPEVFTLDEERSEKIHNDLIGLTKMLPIGTVIHQQTFIYESTYKNKDVGAITNYLAKENISNHVGKPILNSYCNIYITFTNRSIKKNASNSSLLRQLNHAFTQPYKDLQKKIAVIEADIMNFTNSLSSMDIEYIRMDDTQLNNSIYDYINISFNTPTNDATKEVVNPISVSDQEDLKIGDKFISILSLSEEGTLLEPVKVPKTIPSSSFNNGIAVPDNIQCHASYIYPITFGLPIDHVVNTIIEITDSDNVINALKLEKRGLNVISSFYPPAKDKQDEIDIFCDTVSKFHYYTAYTSVNVVLSDTDRNNLMKKISLTKLAFSNMNQSACTVENFETANILFSTIPGNGRSNYRGFVNTTAQAVNYLNKEGMFISHPKGFTYCDRFGTPTTVDLWDYPSLDNRNMIIIGPPGSGKSVFLNELGLQSFVFRPSDLIDSQNGKHPCN